MSDPFFDIDCCIWSYRLNFAVPGQGGSVPDILSPFQSYDQHHHNLNYYMYLQSQSQNTGHSTGHHHALPTPISSHYNN